MHIKAVLQITLYHVSWEIQNPRVNNQALGKMDGLVRKRLLRKRDWEKPMWSWNQHKLVRQTMKRWIQNLMKRLWRKKRQVSMR